MLLMGLPLALTGCSNNDNDGNEIVICPQSPLITAVIAQENAPLTNIADNDIVLTLENIVACNPETGEFKLKDVKRIEDVAYPLPTQSVIRFYVDKRFIFEAKLNSALSSYLPSGLTFTHWWTDAEGCAKFVLDTIISSPDAAEQAHQINELYQLLNGHLLVTDVIDYNWGTPKDKGNETPTGNEENDEEYDDDADYTYSNGHGESFYMSFSDEGSSYSPQTFFSTYFHLPEGNTFQFGRDRSVELNGLYFKAHEYHQYYQDVKVNHSAIILHYSTSNSDLLTDVNGTYYKVKGVNTTPKLSVDEAKARYAETLGTDTSEIHEQTEMVVLPLTRTKDGGSTQENVFRLAYHLKCKTMSDIGDAYIDARTGRLLLALPNYMQ